MIKFLYFRAKYEVLRKKIIDMVIYTDMGRHFEAVEKFSLLCSVNRFIPSVNSSPNETPVKVCIIYSHCRAYGLYSIVKHLNCIILLMQI